MTQGPTTLKFKHLAGSWSMKSQYYSGPASLLAIKQPQQHVHKVLYCKFLIRGF